MERELLEREFNRFARNYQEDEIMWDDRARELRIYAKEDREFPALDFLSDYMELKGKKILDIGFGSGKYLVPFKRAGAEVYGIELSEKMFNNALDYTDEEEPGEYHLYKEAWEEVDLKEKGWENYFDLVFVSKSPVMNGVENLEKIIRASKDKVFLITHVTREDQIDLEIKKLLQWKEEEEKGPGVLYYLYNYLYLQGIFPDIKMTRSERKNIDSSKIMIKKYLHRYKNKGANEKEIDVIRKRLEEISKDEKIVLEHHSLLAYILFERKRDNAIFI